MRYAIAVIGGYLVACVMHQYAKTIHAATNDAVDAVLPPKTWLHKAIRAVAVFLVGEWR